MNKELRKRIWEEREKVNDLLEDVDEDYNLVDTEDYCERLESVYNLLDDIIQDILMEDK